MSSNEGGPASGSHTTHDIPSTGGGGASSILEHTINFIRSVASKAVRGTGTGGAAEPGSRENGGYTGGAGKGRVSPVVIIGLNGIQGSGKSTLAQKLKDTLFPHETTQPAASSSDIPARREDERPSTATDKIIRSFTILSLDDFYLPHTELTEFSIRTGNVVPAPVPVPAPPPTAATALPPPPQRSLDRTPILASTKVGRPLRRNPLLQGRGQPGTHDIPLLLDVLAQLKDLEKARSGSSVSTSFRKIRIPRYDKSAHAGRGDRVPVKEWDETLFEIEAGVFDDDDDRSGGGHAGIACRDTSVQTPPEDDLLKGKKDVNSHIQEPSGVHVVLLEGWCLGFAPLGDEQIRKIWSKVMESSADDGAGGENYVREPTARPRRWADKVILEDMYEIDHYLRRNRYAELNGMLDAFIHLDAKDTDYVYDWRLQQEAGLRELTGRGMTDEQVIDFVDRYYPSYEVYLPRLRYGHLYDTRQDHAGEGDAPSSAATADPERKRGPYPSKTPQIRPRLHFTLGSQWEMVLTRTDEVVVAVKTEEGE